MSNEAQIWKYPTLLEAGPRLFGDTELAWTCLFQYVAVIVNFQLLRTSVTVREEPNVPEILKVQMINLKTKISQRPGAQAIRSGVFILHTWNKSTCWNILVLLLVEGPHIHVSLTGICIDPALLQGGDDLAALVCYWFAAAGGDALTHRLNGRLVLVSAQRFVRVEPRGKHWWPAAQSRVSACGDHLWCGNRSDHVCLKPPFTVNESCLSFVCCVHLVSVSLTGVCVFFFFFNPFKCLWEVKDGCFLWFLSLSVFSSFSWQSTVSSTSLRQRKVWIWRSWPRPHSPNWRRSKRKLPQVSNYFLFKPAVTVEQGSIVLTAEQVM